MAAEQKAKETKWKRTPLRKTIIVGEEVIPVSAETADYFEQLENRVVDVLLGQEEFDENLIAIMIQLGFKPSDLRNAIRFVANLGLVLMATDLIDSKNKVHSDA